MGSLFDKHMEEIIKQQPSTIEILHHQIEEDYKKMRIFRILSLTILDHLVLGDIHLDFCQNGKPGTTVEEIHSSVVIGANGIGKSYLLRAVADIFCLLDSIKANPEELKNEVKFKFRIKYVIYGFTFEFGNFSDVNPVDSYHKTLNHYWYKRDGLEVTITTMDLPVRIIGSTMTVTDKFNTVGPERYRYKGIRNENSPGTTGTRTVIRKTVNGLMHSLDVKAGFREEVKHLLEALGFEPKMEVSYSIRYKDYFLKEDMTAEQLKSIFVNQRQIFEGKRTTELWGTRYFEKIKEDREKLERAAIFLRYAAERNNGKNKRSVIISYNVLENDDIVLDRDAIEILSSLDLLTFPSLKVYKKEPFDFSESSSGETHVLCQLLGIMSDIEHGSLILIDEPENSTHPNWQISYIGWLKEIFKAYYDCHFIISTHSHFILSDLQPESSDIIALEKKDNVIKDVADGLNTFNWSVDDILYEVFHVRNVKNEALERDLERAFQLIDEGGPLKKEEIDILLTRFKNVYRGERDPLRKLIIELEDYAKSRS